MRMRVIRAIASINSTLRSEFVNGCLYGERLYTISSVPYIIPATGESMPLFRGRHSRTYSDVWRLLVCAAYGGSNGNRSRLWKLEFSRVAGESELAITVCHFPPGTSKWNKIERRVFAHISMNWRGRPAHQP